HDHTRQQCVIEIVEYSVAKCSVGWMRKREMVSMLESPWARVRWINVGEISWDVLSALAMRYGV
ncbi:uncharacterized protein C8Q71DRAFT_683074, partial [Rhodofomes roseus]